LLNTSQTIAEHPILCKNILKWILVTSLPVAGIVNARSDRDYLIMSMKVRNAAMAAFA
jgi:hypothetical protein